ncbi:hypothetical protein [Ralstonia chuxiongensis]|uniref:hypothetical protein n=1 Tax=Ralstonia chuxiongensis TaxID=2957504 RepID=UPI0028F5FD72|nr:hypothetical protein [Ralstonia chuxiongensis]CAJ0777766.1 hypothetical protein R8510_04407 [Ralstonia chuxiongensis]
MTLYLAIEPSEDAAFVLFRASANPGPERKPPVRVLREDLTRTIELLLDTAAQQTGGLNHGA